MNKFEDSFWVGKSPLNYETLLKHCKIFDFLSNADVLPDCTGKIFVYKLLFLLFINRNKKATKNCGNCVAKAMSFAVKFRLFLTKGS